MLAAKVDLEKLQFPVLVSPKIDGIRCIIKDGIAYSRTMKPIRNRVVQEYLQHKAPNGMDGELCVGNPYDPNLMQQTSSGVMSEMGAPDFSYCVFDLHHMKSGYLNRYNDLEQICARFPGSRIKLVKHTLVRTMSALLAYEETFLSLGYEGLMIRHIDGPYKQGRSTVREGWLLKMKRFTDSEAIVIGYKELRHNDNPLQKDERGYAKRSHAMLGMQPTGMLGALLVKDLESGIEFDIGTGFNDQQRKDMWNFRLDLIGKMVTYKHFTTTGVKDAPRMPVFKSFRDPGDR
jgi:DNA ligase-1